MTNILSEFIMMIFIVTGILGLCNMLALIVIPYAAAPIYASLLFIEFFISSSGSGVPKFLQFKRPRNGMNKVCMDIVASIPTIIGRFYLLEMNKSLNQKSEFIKLLFSHKILHPVLPYIFCGSIFLLY